MDARVQRTMERMEEELQRPVGMREFAAAVGLSVTQLTRLFRIHTGTTPAAFLKRLRIARARVLVERTSLSIAEIMARVGISDRSHFARAFRNAYGLSPRTLRVQLRMTGRALDARGR